MTYVLLSIGSNIDREKNIRYSVERITQEYGDITLSPVYETVSVGFKGPSFFNLVLGFNSNESLLDIREHLRNIESEAGRVRGKKSFANRVLDIDVILFGDQDLSDQGFNIPRDEIEKYAYVLKPLSDLHPEMVHPVIGETYLEMWERFDQSDQMLSVSEFVF